MEINKLIVEGNRLLQEAQFAHNSGNDSECYSRLSELWGFLTDELAGSAQEKRESAESSKT